MARTVRDSFSVGCTIVELHKALQDKLNDPDIPADAMVTEIKVDLYYRSMIDFSPTPTLSMTLEWSA